MELLKSRKGMMMETRDYISALVGLVLLAVGLIPLLNQWGVISFGLPDFLSGLVASVFFWIIAVGGLYVLIDGLIEPRGHSMHTFLMVLGFVFVIVGLIPILNQFGVISFEIPFLENLVVYNILITIEGLMLVIGGVTMR